MSLITAESTERLFRKMGLKTRAEDPALNFDKNDPKYPKKKKQKTSRQAKKTRNITRTK